MKSLHNYHAWDINPADFPAAGNLVAQIKHVCQYGVLAPSAHNTQPWSFSFDDGIVLIRPDRGRQLGDGDLAGRQTWLSLGACVANIVTAARAYGLQVAVKFDDPDQTVKLSFSPRKAHSIDQTTLAGLVSRCTNRWPFRTEALPANMLRTIEASNSDAKILVKATSRPDVKELAADLTGRGINMALSLPVFKLELAKLIRPPWTTRPDGIPGSTLGLGRVKSLLAPWLFRYTDLAASEGARERRLMLACGGLILVFSQGDTQPFWLAAGRAYQRAALAATKLGLATATVAAAVEAPDFHQEIEAAVGTSYRLQTVMRIGYPTQAGRHSPRHTLAEVTSIAKP